MGLFDRFKKPAPPEPVTFPAVLGSVANGTFCPQEELPDELFSSGAMGPCCGVEPSEGKIYAPIDAKVTTVFHTMHAFGLEAGGMEILIHVGMDTVDMNGDGFSSKIKAGQTVCKGDLLLNVDLDKVRAAGHPTVTVVVITNADDFGAVDFLGSGKLAVGDAMIRVSK